ncbi:MAG TPA: DUF721 domain-containing protein [Bacteroidia bacterium]|nr:DUF721 domain-containing protein [Bacteroidia bacterium]
MKSNEKSIKEVIDELLKNYRLDTKLNEINLINSWEKITGKMIAKHTQKIFIHKQCLYVTLDSAALRMELSHEKAKIIKMLNEAAGLEVISEIVFK